ncbi:HTTM domain-containing protein [Pseudofulvibacter geojedonensis]|uniref:HTTM domain-containing protein n=1 Tax=Pseudofulvibacter geojedonensis TaxID=1123758 RepID=A0ABW3I402_9FLAO
MNKFLFKQIDNSALVVFRIFFGLLIFLESVGAIFTGWIKRTLIDPEFTFSMIGFEWLQPLPGYGMYAYYIIMGIFGLGVMLGYKYRVSIVAFTVMWTLTYLMQKASYNNHYYLLILISVFMCLVPAHKYASLDVKINPEIKSIKMPNWCRWVFIIQMAIVYTYGSLNKVYADWLDTSVIEIFMLAKKHYYIVGEVLQEKWVHYFLAYGGILYDGLVIPLLLYKPTRKLALICSIFFHIFNAIVFQVGIFPFLSLAFILFFYDPKVIHKLFLKSKKYYEDYSITVPAYSTLFKAVFVGYFLIQVGLPLRHWFIKGDVLKTEEGHRLSWRMMLRTKSGVVNYKVVDKSTGQSTIINHYKMVSPKQRNMLATKPDVMWQFIQRLKKQYKNEGKEVEIYIVNSKVSVNGKPYESFINPDIDMAKVSWNTFVHSPWILD